MTRILKSSSDLNLKSIFDRPKLRMFRDLFQFSVNYSNYLASFHDLAPSIKRSRLTITSKASLVFDDLHTSVDIYCTEQFQRRLIQKIRSTVHETEEKTMLVGDMNIIFYSQI